MIPKKIHYCWFGKGKMPSRELKCIASWKNYMPEYELILWNESNFNIDSNSFTKEAYQKKKYAFVSDYVRLYVLINEGGKMRPFPDATFLKT
jgi:mannosyltransferase OCH1-like enzyme